VKHLQPLILNLRVRQAGFTVGLRLPKVGRASEPTTPTYYTPDYLNKPAHKDLNPRTVRRNILTGRTLRSAINLTQAVPSTPSSSLFYSLRGSHSLSNTKRPRVGMVDHNLLLG